MATGVGGDRDCNAGDNETLMPCSRSAAPAPLTKPPITARIRAPECGECPSGISRRIARSPNVAAKMPEGARHCVWHWPPERRVRFRQLTGLSHRVQCGDGTNDNTQRRLIRLLAL